MDIKLTPRNLVYVVFKRRRAVIGFFLACLALNALYIWLASAKYESEAQVMVKVNFTNPDLARPDFAGTANNTSAAQQSPQISDDVLKSLIASYKALMTSQDVLTDTVKKITPERLYPTLKNSLMYRYFFNGTLLNKAVEKLDDDIDVKQLKETSVLEVSVLNRDPVVARETLRTLLSQFFSLQQNVFRSPATSFVEGELEVARSHAQAEDQALRQFKVQYQLSSIPDERTQLLTERTDISDNLDAARSTLSGALARKEALTVSL